MRTFGTDRQTDGQTDRQTDGGGFIRTPEGVLKKHMSTSRDIEFGDKNNLETGLKWG